MRRAVFRALRRGSSAAYLQHGNRRGALFHRSVGAASQAIRRGPAVFPSARPQAMYGPPRLQAECFGWNNRSAPMYPASALCAPCQDGDSHARLLTRYTTSKGPLPATGLPNADQPLGHLCVHPPADFMRPSSCRDAPARPTRYPFEAIAAS